MAYGRLGGATVAAALVMCFWGIQVAAVTIQADIHAGSATGGVSYGLGTGDTVTAGLAPVVSSHEAGETGVDITPVAAPVPAPDWTGNSGLIGLWSLAADGLSGGQGLVVQAPLGVVPDEPVAGTDAVSRDAASLLGFSGRVLPVLVLQPDGCESADFDCAGMDLSAQTEAITEERVFDISNLVRDIPAGHFGLTAVPLPASFVLFAGALGVVAIGWRKR